MNYKYLNINYLSGDIVIMTVNRPTRLNAITSEILDEISDCFRNLNNAHYLIITGQGNKSFIAGGDIGEMNNMSPVQFEEFLKKGQKLSLKIQTSELISIACVNGYALGGGLEIALSCDFVFASESAVFGFPEVKLGIIPGFGGNERIVSRLGIQKAKEMILTGRNYSALESQSAGLVDKVFKAEDLLNNAVNFIHGLGENSFKAMIAAKQTNDYINNIQINKLFDFEREKCVSCFSSDDRQKRMKTFINIRK